jgi:hypothetical protein
MFKPSIFLGFLLAMPFQTALASPPPDPPIDQEDTAIFACEQMLEAISYNSSAPSNMTLKTDSNSNPLRADTRFSSDLAEFEGNWHIEDFWKAISAHLGD